MDQQIILVNIIKSVISEMNLTIDDVLVVPNYQPGTSSQIMKSLTEFDHSDTFYDKKYPLIAMLLPVRIEISDGLGYYGKARIERIVIATLTNSTDDVLTRYQTNGTFGKILYPCYYEFLKRLSYSQNISESQFKHTIMDNPGTQPLGSGVRDYVDSLEILNLEFTLLQNKTC